MNLNLIDINLSNVLTTGVIKAIEQTAETKDMTDDDLNTLVLTVYEAQANKVVADPNVVGRLSVYRMNRTELNERLDAVKEQVRQRVVSYLRNK